jgi:hypothetical protein
MESQTDKQLEKPLKVWPNENGVVIQHGFTSGGEHYYYIKDSTDLPSQRAMMALEMLDRWENRCSPEYLKAFVLSLKEYTTKQLDLSEVYKLINELDERINFAIPSQDIVWMLMSVMFFDENENPFKFDATYGDEKIKRWIENKDIPPFFLIQPLKELLTLPQLSQEGLSYYLKAMNLLSKKHIEHLLERRQLEITNPDLYTALNYQKDLTLTHPT